MAKRSKEQQRMEELRRIAPDGEQRATKKKQNIKKIFTKADECGIIMQIIGIERG